MGTLAVLGGANGWSSLADLLRSWHSVLWIGMALLVLAQAVLSRTRWSESRPLALCVTLSVLAHLLLIIYAYGARFGGPGPGRLGLGAGETVVHLNFELDDAAGDDWLPNEQLTDTVPDDRPMDDSADLEPKDTTTSVANNESAQLAAEPLVDDRPVERPIEAAAAVEVAKAVELDRSVDRVVDAPPSTLVDVDAVAGQVTTPVPPAPVAEPHAAPLAMVPVAAVVRGADLRRQADQQPLPTVYQNRLDADRVGLLLRFGGSADTEAAVHAALGWLAANQAADGRWDADAHGAGREARILGHDRGGAGARADTGITGLAILALMGAGNTHLAGDQREAVQFGLEFLLRSQRSDGNLAGDAEFFARMYCHGIATLALSEAYAITGDKRLKAAVERAIKYTISSQHPTSGGWRYQPGDTGDMSQFGWQVMALKSAELAGFEIPAATRAGMERFLDSVTTGRDRGLASYRPREQASRTMTAEGLVCRFFMNRCADHQVTEATKFVLEETPGKGQVNFYYWYYATLALHQAQGEAWQTWNERLKARLLSTQRDNGPQAGSWDPDPVWGNYGGRVFSTALGALCLESYYRYLPLSEPENRMARRR